MIHHRRLDGIQSEKKTCLSFMHPQKLSSIGLVFLRREEKVVVKSDSLISLG